MNSISLKFVCKQYFNIWARVCFYFIHFKPQNIRDNIRVLCIKPTLRGRLFWSLRTIFLVLQFTFNERTNSKDYNSCVSKFCQIFFFIELKLDNKLTGPREEVIAIFMEWNGHHSICEVECFLNSIAMVNVDIYVEYSWMVSDDQYRICYHYEQSFYLYKNYLGKSCKYQASKN